VCDYGTAAKDRKPPPQDLNPGYEESRWIGLDFGGDAGLPELSVMLLDYYAHTLDDDMLSSYLPLLSETLEFFYHHFERDQRGFLSVFPTQALETYWCTPPPNTTFENCPVNDAPTISALHVLTRRALELPNISQSQRNLFTSLRNILPDVRLCLSRSLSLSISTHPHTHTHTRT